ARFGPTKPGVWRLRSAPTIGAASHPVKRSALRWRRAQPARAPPSRRSRRPGGRGDGGGPGHRRRRLAAWLGRHRDHGRGAVRQRRGGGRHRRPLAWLWAVLVGAWAPLLESGRDGNPASIVALGFAAAGAGLGWAGRQGGTCSCE